MDLCEQEPEAPASWWSPVEELAPPAPATHNATPAARVEPNGGHAATSPYSGLFDDDSASGRIAHRLTQGFMGEGNLAENPAAARTGEKLKARYQADAYQALGLSEEEFSRMDPIQRNQRINAAYAKMYKSDPDTFKWAGMAAMASDKAGTGMLQTYMLETAKELPGGATAERVVGAPEGGDVRAWLAKGNGGIFNDMYWQHLAFQNGGVAELEKAGKEGSITKEQLEGWQQLAAAQAALKQAKEGGDPQAIQAAQAGIWGGNKTLLHAEQGFVQEQVYSDSRWSADAFRFLSSRWNLMGVDSPVPGGKSFGDNRKGKHGANDVGDFGQRWDWIEQDMLPEYQAFETQKPEAMNAQMEQFIARENSNPWMDKVLIPALPYVRALTQAGGAR